MRQLRRIIRNVLLETYGKRFMDYPDEIFHGVKCVDCAKALWDAARYGGWSRSDDVNIWLNEEQGGDLDTGHPYEIVGPDKVRTTTYAGEEVYLTAEEACNFNPEG